MSKPVDNDHRFNVESKQLQMDLIADALEQARAYQCPKELTPARAGGAARRICNAIFDNFEKGLRDIAKRITVEYPEEDYSDLVSLLMDSRTNLFCVDLQGRVKSLILGEDSTDAAGLPESKT